MEKGIEFRGIIRKFVVVLGFRYIVIVVFMVYLGIYMVRCIVWELGER